VLAWSGAYDEALSALELAWAGVGQPFAGLAADIVAVHRLAERARRRRVRDAKEVRQ
jgi:hypothetical protein